MRHKIMLKNLMQIDPGICLKMEYATGLWYVDHTRITNVADPLWRPDRTPREVTATGAIQAFWDMLTRNQPIVETMICGFGDKAPKIAKYRWVDGNGWRSTGRILEIPKGVGQ